MKNSEKAKETKKSDLSVTLAIILLFLILVAVISYMFMEMNPMMQPGIDVSAELQNPL